MFEWHVGEATVWIVKTAFEGSSFVANNTFPLTSVLELSIVVVDCIGYRQQSPIDIDDFGEDVSISMVPLCIECSSIRSFPVELEIVNMSATELISILDESFKGEKSIDLEKWILAARNSTLFSCSEALRMIDPREVDRNEGEKGDIDDDDAIVKVSALSPI